MLGYAYVCSDTLFLCCGIMWAEYDFNRMLGECAREWYFMYSNGIVYLCVFEDKLFGVWYTDYVLEIPTAAQTRPRTVFFMPCIRAHSTCTHGDIF